MVLDIVGSRQLEDRIIFIVEHQKRPLPPSGASFGLLLLNLGTERVLSLFYHVLTHQKMLIHTLNMKDLTPCLEGWFFFRSHILTENSSIIDDISAQVAVSLYSSLSY